jgi:enoyl-CoA hydratase/carnithine racemase
MAAPTTDTVKYEKRDRVAWIHLNRPEAMNALNPEISVGIRDAINDATADDDILVVVLIGEGGRAFCTGMDLKWRAQEDAAGAALSADTVGPGTGLQAVGGCPKPVIAAIDGYALAGGMQLSNRCDIRIATKQSKFGMPEARRALAAVGSEDTPELFTSAGEAAWILLTGGHMSAERAYQNGLVQVLVENREELLAETEKLAGEIKLCAPLAIRAIKETLRTKRNMPAADPGVKQLEQLAVLTKEVKERNNNSEDRMEGPKAFAEKRAPNWQNR